MSTTSIAIPYEKQADPQINRGCGAACLSMVYRSFGKEVPQAGIWPLIAKQNRSGSLASTTHLMALHALNQGLSAVTIQARHPLQVLRICRENGIRAILNHRLGPDSAAGHFTVLLDINDHNVVLHDPFLGPSRQVPHAELLQLWQPQSPDAEIAGNVLIGIAADPAPLPACEFCHTIVPSKIDCPRCGKAIGLQPGDLLGCIRDGCIARMWNYVACPLCDFMWSFNEAGTSAADFPRATPGAVNPIADAHNFAPLFEALDKFTGHVMSIPGAANHPDVKANLDLIASCKDKIKFAQAEELANHKTRLDQMTALREESQAKEEAHRKRVEALKTPPPPLDGNALGHALLKNLGFK